MNALLAVLSAAMIAVLFERLGVVSRASKVSRIAAESLRVVRDPDVSDRIKEKALRGSAVRSASLGLQIIGLSLLAIVIPLAALSAMEAVGFGSVASVLSIWQRLDFILGAAILGTIAFFISRTVARS